MATPEEELRRRIRSLEVGQAGTREMGAFSEEFQSRTDSTLARAREKLRELEARERADMELESRLSAGGGEPEGDEPEGRVSPGGLGERGARVLRTLREREGFTPLDVEGGPSRLERVLLEAQRGEREELTLGFGEQFEEIDPQLGEINLEDVAAGMGRIAGALPLALATGGLSQVVARGAAPRLLNFAARNRGVTATAAKKLGRALDFVSRLPEEQASRAMKAIARGSRNLYEGLAFSLVSGGLRRLEEGESRAVRMAEEFGIGVAADFLLGMALPFGMGAQVTRRLKDSDNLLLREVGDEVENKIIRVDEADVEVGRRPTGAAEGEPGRLPGREEPRLIGRQAPEGRLPGPGGTSAGPPRTRGGGIISPGETGPPGSNVPPAPRRIGRQAPEEPPARPLETEGRPGPAGEERGARPPTPDGEPGPLSREDLARLRRENRELRRQRDVAQRESMTDNLTGLGNSRAFSRARPRVEQDPSQAVVMFDLVNFKAVNDIEGQSAGDAVLEEAGAAVRQAAEELGVSQKGGNVFRHGGDEFAVIAPADQAERVARRAEEIFGTRQVEGEEQTFEVRFRSAAGQTADEADAAIRAAKRGEEGPRFRDLAGGGPTRTRGHLTEAEMNELRPRVQKLARSIEEARTLTEVFEKAGEIRDLGAGPREQELLVRLINEKQEIIARGGEPPPGPRKAPGAAEEGAPGEAAAGRPEEPTPNLQRALRRLERFDDPNLTGAGLRTGMRELADDPTLIRESTDVGALKRLKAFAEKHKPARGQREGHPTTTIREEVNNRLEQRAQEIGEALARNRDNPSRIKALRNEMNSLPDELQDRARRAAKETMQGEPIRRADETLEAVRSEYGDDFADLSGKAAGIELEGIDGPVLISPALEGGGVRATFFDAQGFPRTHQNYQSAESAIRNLAAGGQVQPGQTARGELDKLWADMRPKPGRPAGRTTEGLASPDDVPEAARPDRVEGGAEDFQMREMEDARETTREPLMRQGELGGVIGRSARIIDATGEETQGFYRVVDAEELTPSHDPHSFEPSEGYPARAQNRDYLNDPNAQAEVFDGAKNPIIEAFIDPTVRPTDGPPLIAMDGMVINGNSRTMMIQRMIRENPSAYRRYKEFLEVQAQQFGLDPADVRGMENPVLVRELAEDEIDHMNVGELMRLNRAFDKQVGKARSPEREAAFRVDALMDAQRALNFLEENIEGDETIRAFLGTARGRGFVDELVSAGVIERRELTRFQDPDGRLTPDGKNLIEKMMEIASVGDPDVARRAPASWMRKVDKVTPAIVKSSRIEGWDLRPFLQDAMEIGARIDDNPSITGAERIRKFFEQTDMFGADEWHPKVVALARVLEDGKHQSVKDALRGYAGDAERARKAIEGGDLFGETVDPDESFRRWFGEAEVDAQGRVHGSRGAAVESERYLGQLRSRASTEEGLSSRTRDRIVELFPEDLRQTARAASDDGLIDFAEERGLFSEDNLRAMLNDDPPGGGRTERPPFKDDPRAGYFDPWVVIEGVKKLGRKLFTGPGDLPRDIWEASLGASRWAKGELRQAEFKYQELRRAAKEVWDTKNPSAAQLKPLRDFLTGEIELEALPEPLRGPAGEIRAHVDALSQMFIDSGLVQGDLAETFANNMGAYLTRTYRIFTTPDWAENVPPDVVNKAISYVQTRGNTTREEAELLVEELLLRADDELVTPLQFLGSGRIAPKDLSILFQRQDIAPEIRALWGEETHPLVNYVRSVDRMTKTLSQHRFMKELREVGLGDFLFEQRTRVGDEDFVAKIVPEDAGRQWDPLQGLRTTKELRDAIREHISPEPGLRGIPGFRHYMKFNAAVKFSKIIPSIATQIRNPLSMMFFSVASGNAPLPRISTAFKTALRPLTKLGDEGTVEVLGKEMPWEDFFQDLVERGVVAESARAGELQDFIRDAAQVGFDDPTANWLTTAPRRALRLGTELYRAGDDVIKVGNFMAEVSKYRAAKPDWSEEQVLNQAARVIRETFPTYSEVPLLARWMRRIPVVGTFVSWPWEVYRTNLNRFRLIAREMRDPDLKGIGAKRLVGFGVGGIGIVGAMAEASRFMFGVSKQEEEDLRRFLPHWSENSPLLMMGRDEEGQRQYIDLGYVDPYEPAKGAYKAFLRGEDWEEKLARGSWELFKPFLEEEILFGRILDLTRNRTKEGREIVNPELPLSEQRFEQFKHIVQAVEPGTIERMRRAVQRGDLRETAVAEFTGQRVRKVDVPRSLSFNARDLSNRRSDATTILSSAVFQENASEDEIRDAYRKMEQARRDVWQEAHDDAMAAYRNQVSRERIIKTLNDAGWSQRDALGIFQGRYFPWVPSARSLMPRMGDSPERMQKIRERRAIVTGLVQQQLRRWRTSIQEEGAAPPEPGPGPTEPDTATVGPIRGALEGSRR